MGDPCVVVATRVFAGEARCCGGENNDDPALPSLLPLLWVGEVFNWPDNLPGSPPLTPPMEGLPR